jgi:hypothetical protein
MSKFRRLKLDLYILYLAQKSIENGSMALMEDYEL